MIKNNEKIDNLSQLIENLEIEKKVLTDNIENFNKNYQTEINELSSKLENFKEKTHKLDKNIEDLNKQVKQEAYEKKLLEDKLKFEINKSTLESAELQKEIESIKKILTESEKKFESDKNELENEKFNLVNKLGSEIDLRIQLVDEIKEKDEKIFEITKNDEKLKKLANETKEKYEKKIEFIIDEKKTLVNQLMSVQQENDQLNECIIRVQQTEREKYLKELENYSKQQNLDYESQIADLYKKNESLTSGAKEKEGLIKNLKNDNQNLKFELKTVTEDYSSQITENNKKISFFKSENEKLLQKNSSLEDKIQDFQLKITKKDEENFYLQKNIDEMLKEFKFLKSISENKTEEISCLKENIGQMLKEIEL